MNRRSAGTVLMAMIVVLGGCARKPAGLESVATAASKNSGNVAPWGIDLSSAPGTKFQATFADDVVQVDAGTVKRTLRGVTRDHDILLFDNVPELRDKLLPGKVVFFQGFTFKRVQAIASDGAQLIVATEPTALTDLFKDANIRWHTSINFRNIYSQKPRTRAASNGHGFLDWLDELEPRVYAAAAEDSESTEEDEEGWKIKSKATFNADRVDFDVDVARHGDIDADIKGNGYVKNFETSDRKSVV